MIYHAGDTDVIPDMQNLSDVDVAFLPIGGTFTMNVDEAVEAARKIKAKITVPMHYLDADPNEFAQKISLDSETTVKVMSIGESLEIS